jgi:PAS domain S-box-containing protein
MQRPPLGGRCLPSGCAGVVRRITHRFLASCIVIVAVSCSSLLAFADSTPEKNVLVLYSWSVRDAFVELDPLKTTLRSRIHAPVNFYVEYLESERFGSAGYQKALSETIRQSYSEKQIDLVVVSAYPALRFAVEHRDQIFPGVPIVFMSVAPNRLPGGTPWPGVTGATTNVDVRGSVDLALRLNPDTKNVALIAGNSEFETFWLGAVRDEVGRRQEKLRLIEISTGSTKRLLEEVSRLPSHTIVFFNLIPQESSQVEIGAYDVLAAIAQRLPTYCVHDYCLDHGAIGGSYTDPSITGVMGGYIAARVLSGEKPENIPVSQASVAHPKVDWRQLRRWNIPESALPPGSIVLYRQPTVWERYEKYIVAGIVLIVVQALLIVGLLWQRARKRRIEANLRESEKRFRVMANTTPSLVWMSDKDGNVTYLNDRRIEFTGCDPTAGFEDVWTAYVHPDDLQSVLTANTRALETRERFSKEYRLRRRDGVYRWMLDAAAPRINGDSEFAGFIGSSSDITEQKMAQEALEKLGGRLIEAQEKERARIARELHDDICQRLSLLSLELELANQSSNSGAPANKRIEDVRQHYSELAGDVQALSHQLHSSKLDYLGLVAAVKSFCREFSAQQRVNIEFTDENVPSPISGDVSLCLFRVVQEALNNAVKYSGVSRFSVDLRGMADQIKLEVSDAGVGFDVDQAKRNGGLGLVSMQERVQLMHGQFSIESKANCGTRILVRVPAGDVNSTSTAAAVS